MDQIVHQKYTPGFKIQQYCTQGFIRFLGESDPRIKLENFDHI